MWTCPPIINLFRPGQGSGEAGPGCAQRVPGAGLSLCCCAGLGLGLHPQEAAAGVELLPSPHPMLPAGGYLHLRRASVFPAS